VGVPQQDVQPPRKRQIGRRVFYRNVFHNTEVHKVRCGNNYVLYLFGCCYYYYYYYYYY
jgi:hypothetical protein